MGWWIVSSPWADSGNLPSWTFQALEWLRQKIWGEPEVAGSMERVDRFVKRVVKKAATEKTSGIYPERLLKDSISESETRAQCKDLMFAGTGSTGMNLATICFYVPLKFKPERWQNAAEKMIRDSIPFGLGARQCVARNLATMELFCAVQRLNRG